MGRNLGFYAGLGLMVVGGVVCGAGAVGETLRGRLEQTPHRVMVSTKDKYEEGEEVKLKDLREHDFVDASTFMRYSGAVLTLAGLTLVVSYRNPKPKN